MSAKRNTAVIITAKDAEDTAPAAVNSALAQSMVSEVVLVDDGSRDNTAAVAQSCDDGSGRLKVIPPGPKPGSFARAQCRDEGVDGADHLYT